MDATNLARKFSLMGSVHCFLSVVLGAFGSHVLKASLEPRLYEVFNTAAYYQFIHAISLLILSLMSFFLVDLKKLSWAGNFLHTGILLFSGSLYIMTLTDFRSLGIITPIGGLCFLSGWLLVGLAAWKGFHNVPKD